MDKFEEYFDKAKDFADDAREGMKDFFGEAVDMAKDLTDDGAKVKEFTENARGQAVSLTKSAKEFTQNARGQAASLTQSAKEKIDGMLQDTRAGKEIKQGLTELENLPEFEGSIVYSMELQSMVSELRALYLLINDNRLDDEAVIDEIKKAMGKVQPEAADSEASLSDEQKAIETAKAVAYGACQRALDVLNTAAVK